MNITSVWRRSSGKKKKVRSTLKPKIRWELLGLSDPGLGEPTAIETIRREISSVASQGVGHGTHSGSNEQDPKRRAGTVNPVGNESDAVVQPNNR